MLLAMIFVAGLQALGNSPRVEPGLKHCRNGSVVTSNDTCLELPDHRYVSTHEPRRRERAQRWWCGRSAQPSFASITIEQRQSRAAQGSMGYDYRVNSLMVDGRPATAPLMRTVRERLLASNSVYDIAGRCLFVRPGAAVPVLVLLTSENGKQRSIEIPLR
ncbi:MAG TPA: hypothetical protein VGD23_06675 [Sphingomicrobium sp.]